MHVVFITVNYNNSKVTENYIKNVLGIDEKNKIIVIDNASIQEELDSLIEIINKYPNVTLICNKENLGYFKGLNVGIKYVMDNQIEYDYMVIGNNDLEFSSDFLEVLADCKLEKRVLAIAPNVFTEDGFFQNPHVVNRVSRVKKCFYSLFFTNYYLGRIMYSIYQRIKPSKNKKRLVTKEQDIYMGIGAVYILTKYFFEHYKSLDDRVFLWGEEALLGNQIKKVNGVIRYIPRLKVKHLESLTTSKIPNKTKYIQMKNSYKIYKHYL